MPRTFVELLQSRAIEQPDFNAYIFLNNTNEETITYKQLDYRSRVIAKKIVTLGFQGKPILIIQVPGIEYIVSLFGCLYAGCIAVPAYPPRNAKQLPRIEAIIKNSGASAALTSTDLIKYFRNQESNTPFTYISTDNILAEDTIFHYIAINNNVLARPSLDAIAILQYTSGSTGTPKGVILTHQNIIHNSYHIYKKFKFNSSDIIGNWLPPYHDMGMIGGVLQPLYSGCQCVLMSPATFIQRPLRWLEAISHYGITVTGGPNFAYEFCVDRIKDEDISNLNLSTWRLAFNGAETIRETTLRHFSDKFQSCGFKAHSFWPCYGLAEATLLVSGKHWENTSASNTPLLNSSINCGSGLDDQILRIVDPSTCMPCEENQEGEIWISSPSVAEGYWNQPELTEITFKALLHSNSENILEHHPYFLRTGDLGRITNNELFITGRIKDIINIRGRKFYPQDIEFSSQQSHIKLNNVPAVAFSITDDNGISEKLILIQEVPARFNDDESLLIKDIRKFIMLEHEIVADVVWLVEYDGIPKTSSGKVRRNQCKQDYLSGLTRGLLYNEIFTGTSNFEVDKLDFFLDDKPSIEQVIAFLQSQLAITLGVEVESIPLEKPIYLIGANSLSLIILKSAIEKVFKSDVTFVVLYESTLKQIACDIVSKNSTIT